MMPLSNSSQASREPVQSSSSVASAYGTAIPDNMRVVVASTPLAIALAAAGLLSDDSAIAFGFFTSRMLEQDTNATATAPAASTRTERRARRPVLMCVCIVLEPHPNVESNLTRNRESEGVDAFTEVLVRSTRAGRVAAVHVHFRIHAPILRPERG